MTTNSVGNSFSARANMEVDGNKYEIYYLKALEDKYNLDRLPYSLKILLENLLRFEDGENITRSDIEALCNWDPKATPSTEITFTPSRVLMQDFTGVPAVVDLAAMRDAMGKLGGDPNLINPLAPADLVIDHSLNVDHFGVPDALDLNSALEFKRNKERYTFLRWGQNAFSNFTVVPPATGIIHQVNLEYLAKVVFGRKNNGVLQAYPDTVVGTDSHTTMINGLGVLGWGVGGIEAEAAMLGQPIVMLIPQVVGFKLKGKLANGVTATDLVLRVVEMLRELGVVGKFVEFFGDGLDHLSLADQATIANMAPEYGATCGIFPIDNSTIEYMRLSGRDNEQVTLAESYARVQGMYREAGAPDAEYSDVLELDMSTVVPNISGPKRPQDRIALSAAKKTVAKHIVDMRGSSKGGSAKTRIDGQEVNLDDGSIVIAAITSCTNTSNPGVVMAAGLVAKKALDLGLDSQPWVKTSLAPGSQVVTGYLEKAGLMEPLSKLGFDVVGYGCTTCIGNSGPLDEAVSSAVAEGDLIACSILSGNRNFEGRVHQEVKMNFLASPPLVVAYALAGTMNIDFAKEPVGISKDGKKVFLKDIWPSAQEVNQAIDGAIDRELYVSKYKDVFKGDKRWAEIKTPKGELYAWTDDSTYIRKAPYFDGMTSELPGIPEIKGAHVLAKLGDSVTTDHISPAGAIAADSPAAKYLESQGVSKVDYNVYGARRGNHEVMMRGTFANIRIRNEMTPGVEGGVTKHVPSGKQMTIFDAAMEYKKAGIPTIIIGGKEYGTGSSRDWAAKGPALQGVKAVIVETFERIHRSNLIGMGILPLQFVKGEDRNKHKLTGDETFEIKDVKVGAKQCTIVVTDGGKNREFKADIRIDTPKEWDYYINGGILHYVLRDLASDGRKAKSA